jgi:HEPN domain-containing protein
MPDRNVDEMLKDRFVGKKHVDAAVKHFGRMVQDYQQSEWDDANAKAGKFVEAVLKALVTEAGETPASGKAFRAGTVLDTIDKKTALPDSLRLTIPRACRFVYEIASNRGARHDADEIEANEMDAKAAVALCSWILAEMVSYSQKGMDLDEAKEAVDGLMRRKYPFMEEIDGRVYWDIASSARETALLILYGVYPKRMSNESLARQVARHGYSQNNANVAVQRIRTRVDNDGHGNLKLRNLGVREAEELIQKAENER